MNIGPIITISTPQSRRADAPRRTDASFGRTPVCRRSARGRLNANGGDRAGLLGHHLVLVASGATYRLVEARPGSA